jgi:hypothetical protein
MIPSIFYRISVVAVLLFCVFTLQAQNKVTVHASVDKNKILIGEQVKLTLEASIPDNAPIHFFSTDTLAHFELLDKSKIDTSNISGGTLLKQFFTITSFDSGHWVIPPFVLDEKNSTDSTPMDVVFTNPFDSSQAYHDIKDIIPVNPAKKDKSWYWFAGVGLFFIILLIYLITKRKKPVPVVKQAAPFDTFKEAMNKLKELSKANLPSGEFHTQLTDIFRQYVYHKKGIQSLQKTTGDLVVQLKSEGLPSEQYQLLSQALQLSDFVKFAKYDSTAKENEIVLGIIKNSIEQIERTS